MTEIFIVKIGLSPELKNDIFEFILSGNKSAIQTRGPKQQNMAYKKRKIWHRIFSLNDVKLSPNL